MHVIVLDAISALSFFREWCREAMASRLEPVKKVVRLFKKHWPNIVMFFRYQLSNALAEGINSRFRHLIQKACGYRNRERFKRDVLFHLGKLDLYPEFLGNPLDVDSLALEREGRVAGYHEELGHPRQARDDILGDAVHKEILSGIAAHVCKRQDRNGGFIRKREGHPLPGSRFHSCWLQIEVPNRCPKKHDENCCCTGKEGLALPERDCFRFRFLFDVECPWLHKNLVRPHRLGNVLDRLLPKKPKIQRPFGASLWKPSGSTLPCHTPERQG